MIEGQYRWRPTWGGEDDFIAKDQRDYTGFDGAFRIGRVYFDAYRNEWRWKGEYLPVQIPVRPDSGFKMSLLEAVAAVDQYWSETKLLVAKLPKL